MTTALPVKMPPRGGPEEPPPSPVAEWLRALIFFLVAFGAVFLGAMLVLDLLLR
ncbi:MULTISPECIES: hypothetical protein [unclassified Brevundimonas]|uniref:hypothetical protein n=1 Tax=unclassified Brevundimonas TaxID=2622653 RepID=UPI0014311679|nr:MULTISPECIES: hypothetical protein [unclassified Brevundimonas]